MAVSVIGHGDLGGGAQGKLPDAGDPSLTVFPGNGLLHRFLAVDGEGKLRRDSVTHGVQGHREVIGLIVGQGGVLRQPLGLLHGEPAPAQAFHRGLHGGGRCLVTVPRLRRGDGQRHVLHLGGRSQQPQPGQDSVRLMGKEERRRPRDQPEHHVQIGVLQKLVGVRGRQRPTGIPYPVGLDQEGSQELQQCVEVILLEGRHSPHISGVLPF